MILGILNLHSCGWFDDKAPPSGEFYESSNAAKLCAIDPEEISLILEKDISKQLWCIRANLEEFSRNVKIRNQSEIGDDELNKFVTSLYGAEASGYIDGIVILFQINTLLIQDQVSTLTVNRLQKLFQSLVLLNQMAVKLNLIFRDVTKENFYKKRQALIKVTRELTTSLGKVIGGGGRMDRSINLYEFMDMLNTKLSDKTNLASALDAGDAGDEGFQKPSMLQRIRSFFRVKTLMVGGERTVLTAKEFRLLLPKFHILAGIIFDLVAKPKDFFDETASEYSHLRNVMENMEEIFHDVPDLGQAVLTLSELKDIADEIGLGETYAKIEPAIASFHNNILGAKNDIISHREIRTSVALFKYAFPLLETYHQVSPLPKKLLEQPLAIRKGLLDKLQMGLENWRMESEDLREHDFFPRSINVNAFLIELKETEMVKDLDIDLFLEVLKIKQVFIGGDKEIWTKEELLSLSSKAYDLATIAYTTTFVEDMYGDQRSDIYKLYKDNANKLSSLLYTQESNAFLITFEDLLSIVDSLQDAVKSIDFLPSLKAIWPKVFKHSEGEVLVGDAKYIFEQVTALMQELEFNHKTMELHPSLMHEKDVIKYINFKRHDYYRSLGSAEFYYLSHRLTHLVDKHRYYLSGDAKAIFDYDVTRTKEGLSAFTSLRFLFEILMEAYGDVISRNPIAITMSRDQVDKILQDFKSIMEPFGLWTKKIKTFARNTILMADLFQDVSNGNMKLDLVEMVDYGSMVLAALTMTNHTLENFTVSCPNVGTKEKPAYEVACYRPNFLHTLLEKFGYKKLLPNLAEYVSNADPKEVLEFLTSTEKFARDIPDDSIPMAKRDFALLIGSLLSIESVYLRFDESRNNIIDQKELDQAYLLFKPALIELSSPKLDGDNRKYAKSAFMYLVKKQEIPGSFDLGVFHYNFFRDISIFGWKPFGEEITAQRINIGVILYYLTKANQKASGEGQ